MIIVDKKFINSINCFAETGEYAELNNILQEYIKRDSFPKISSIATYVELYGSSLDRKISTAQRELAAIRDELRECGSEVRASEKVFSEIPGRVVDIDEFKFIAQDYAFYGQLIDAFDKDNRYLVCWWETEGLRPKPAVKYFKNNYDVIDYLKKEFQLDLVRRPVSAHNVGYVAGE